MATIVDIADSVVADLNAAFSQTFTAERHYLPRFKLPELEQLKVTVVPRGLTIQALDRGRDRCDYEIDVAVQQRTNLTKESLDALMTLAEEIADRFRGKRLASFPAARCIEVKNEPVYAPEHLEEFRQFTSVMTLTFSLAR